MNLFLLIQKFLLQLQAACMLILQHNHLPMQLSKRDLKTLTWQQYKQQCHTLFFPKFVGEPKIDNKQRLSIYNVYIRNLLLLYILQFDWSISGNYK